MQGYKDGNFSKKNIGNVNNGRKINNKKIKKKWGFFLKTVIISIVSLLLFYFLTLAPHKRQIDVVVEVKKGDGASILAKKLKDEELIRSENVFKIILKLKGIAGKIHVGKYEVSPNDTVFDIVDKIEKNEIIDESIKFTILSGWPNYKIAERLDLKMKKFGKKDFSKEVFLEKAKEKEGYLYPDTYKIDPEFTEEDMINQFYQNYKNKIKEFAPNFQEDLKKINKTEKEVLIMASIVEAEAGNVTMKDKRVVAGVLWHRLDIGIPLQADAVFSYIKQEHISKVLNKDLEVESEYNIYKKKGLPPGPIGNPGLSSIKATITPEKTDYLYYLTDKRLKFHYAISYKKHLENQKKYITNAE